MSKEFEIARLQMVKAALDGEIDPARGYAWSHRIFPFNPTLLEEAFEEDFKVGRVATRNVLKAIDEGRRTGKFVSFYDLEGLPGMDSPSGLNRMEIYHVCRLAFLEDRFETAVWKALTVAGSGPVETQGMADPYGTDRDIYF